MGTIANKWKISVVVATLVIILVAGIAIAGLYLESKSVNNRPSELRVAVLPDQNPEDLRRRYSPLIKYLSKQTGRQARLVIPADYHDAISLFRDDKIDLAYFGGLTFVQAQARYGAVPLVMREIDTRFTSWFLVKPEFAQMQLSDFRGKRLSFGNWLSTSGHLMPRHFLLQQWQIDPVSFFSEVSFSGAHDKTAMLVRDGKVDLGAVNSAVIGKLIADGRLGADELHVLWQTPPYPDYVWAMQKNLGEALEIRLRDAFLGLDPDIPYDGRILDGLNANTYLPADPGDFKILGEIASKLGLMEPGAK